MNQSATRNRATQAPARTPFAGFLSAEAYRAANRTPSQEQLVRFLTHQPRPLPVAPPAAHFSPAGLAWALTLLGAVLLGIVGAWLHH
jgi:hypothetical protein